MTKIIYLVYRLKQVFQHILKVASLAIKTAFNSRETSTYTYKLTTENEAYLKNIVATITQTSFAEVTTYFEEIYNDKIFQDGIKDMIAKSNLRKKKDLRTDFGSRIAWYAFVRILKPKVIVENGVEIGFTASILCKALERNYLEGNFGKYYGLDIDNNAGFLIKKQLNEKSIAKIILGDAIESIRNLDEKVDFYFSDGIRTYEYEQEEFMELNKKINKNSIVVTNKALFSKALFEASMQSSRKFIYFQEAPLKHWYKGAGIGILY